MSKKTANTIVEIKSSEKASDYVNKFTIAVNKCAENVLEMCKIVHEAQDELPKEEFEYFCKEINLTSKSAISKMKTIGQAYSKLAGYKDDLPGAWTTLYHISRMKDEDLIKAHAEKIINPMTTAKQLKQVAPYLFRNSHAGELVNPVMNDDQVLFSIKSVTTLAVNQLEEIKKKLIEICAEYQCDLA